MHEVRKAAHSAHFDLALRHTASLEISAKRARRVEDPARIEKNLHLRAVSLRQIDQRLGDHRIARREMPGGGVRVRGAISVERELRDVNRPPRSVQRLEEWTVRLGVVDQPIDGGGRPVARLARAGARRELHFHASQEVHAFSCWRSHRAGERRVEVTEIERHSARRTRALGATSSTRGVKCDFRSVNTARS